MSSKQVYKVIFRNQDKIYEIYAHEVNQSPLFGFIEVGEMIFGERSAVLVDPGEEKLASEFNDVEFSLIPLQSIIRIDKVAKEGSNKVLPGDGITGNNVTAFPGYTPPSSGE